MPEGEWRERLDGAVAAGGGEARRFRPEGDDGAERTAARAGGGGFVFNVLSERESLLVCYYSTEG